MNKGGSGDPLKNVGLMIRASVERLQYDRFMVPQGTGFFSSSKPQAILMSMPPWKILL